MELNLVILLTLSEFALGLFFIFVAKKIRDWITQFDDDAELFKKDNPALGIAKAGYYLAIFIAFSGLVKGDYSIDEESVFSIQDSLISFCAHGGLILLLINLSNILTDRFILYRFKIYDEICQNRNEGVAWAICGTYIGTALIIQGAVSGEEANLMTSLREVLVYFALGQIMLMVASGILSAYLLPSLQDEIKSGNTSRGIAFGGYLISIGLILGGSISGDMDLEKLDLQDFLVQSTASIIVLTFVRFFLFNWIFAGGVSLKKEISEDQNRAAGWISAFGSIGLALFIKAIMA